MAYATEAEFNELGLPLVALDGFTGDVEQHLEIAAGKIDSYLRGRYKLPVSGDVPELKDVNCILAAYSVVSIRGFDPEAEQNKNIRLRYEDSLEWLERLADGKVNLDTAVDATPGKEDGGPIVKNSRYGRRLVRSSWCDDDC